VTPSMRARRVHWAGGCRGDARLPRLQGVGLGQRVHHVKLAGLAGGVGGRARSLQLLALRVGVSHVGTRAL